MDNKQKSNLIPENWRRGIAYPSTGLKPEQIVEYKEN